MNGSHIQYRFAKKNFFLLITLHDSMNTTDIILEWGIVNSQ